MIPGDLMKRQEWMLGSSSKGDPLDGLFSGGKKKEEQSTKPKVSTRELNPYFKEGGTGLPPGADLLTRGRFVKPSDEKNEEKGRAGTISEQGVNKLVARKIRAEMTGDLETARELEQEIKKLQTTTLSSPSTASDIQKLVVEERKGPQRRYDQEIATAISKKGRFSNMEDFSDTFRAGHKRPLDERDISQVIRDEKKRTTMQNQLKLEKIQGKCELCFESETIDMSLVLAIGNFTFLTLPHTDWIDPFHCRIVPIQHTSSTLQCDDDIWDEIRNFKKSILQFAASLGRKAVFLETVPRPDGLFHTHIDVILCKDTVATDPGSYFRKALLECDEEWTSNKNVIDTLEKGGLRKSIPRDFAYCYVDLRLDQGFAHIIEDARRVRYDFLLELAASLLGLQRHQWKGKIPLPGTIDKFRKLFEPFDWTRLLCQ